jgi:hypothetical protein
VAVAELAEKAKKEAKKESSAVYFGKQKKAFKGKCNRCGIVGHKEVDCKVALSP